MTKGTTPRMIKGTHTRLSFALLALVSLVATPSALTTPAARFAPRFDPPAVAALAQTKVVRGEWASVTHDPSLAEDIRAETLAADLLEQASDKPDGIYPAHVAFTLVGLRPSPPQLSPDPVLRVCPVAEYKLAFAVNPRYVRKAEETLRGLRSLLRRKPAALPREVPTLPFPDASDAFHAHVRYLRFRGGGGVAYLTQGQQDEGLVNNQSISYEFRGLTDDGLYYVTASLPVAAPFLPATREVTSFEGYTLPRSFSGKYAARRRREYNAYVERVRRRLDRLAPERFQPSLRLYDALFRSLEISR
jgi:hypothetical protein